MLRSLTGKVGKAMSSTTFCVHPDNHRCFLYQGKPLKILTSAEHYGAVLNADFDYRRYVEEMARTGQNMTRVFTFYRETPEHIPPMGAQNSLAPTPQASILPWERVRGHGTAADGLDRFDLTRWNAAYFARLKDFVSQCARHGILCEITLFCNPYSRDRLECFPCGPGSNINGVGEALREPYEFMTLRDPATVAVQVALVKKLAQELNSFDNVYYEICNEPAVSRSLAKALEPELAAWHAHLAAALREAERDLPKRHLIAANAHLCVPLDGNDDTALVRHEEMHYLSNRNIDILNYHYLSAHHDVQGLGFTYRRGQVARAGNTWRFLRARDSFKKPIVCDETFSGVVHGEPERYAINRAEAWEAILSGAAGYNNLDWSFTPDDETGSGRAPIADGRHLDGRPLREWYALLRRLLENYDLASLVPATTLLPDSIPGYGHAASTDGKGRYLVYLVDERLYLFEPCPRQPVSLCLCLPAGVYAVRTFDPKTGAQTALTPLRSNGSAQLQVPAFAEDVALLVDRQDSEGG